MIHHKSKIAMALSKVAQERREMGTKTYGSQNRCTVTVRPLQQNAFPLLFPSATSGSIAQRNAARRIFQSRGAQREQLRCPTVTSDARQSPICTHKLRCTSTCGAPDEPLDGEGKACSRFISPISRIGLCICHTGAPLACAALSVLCPSLQSRLCWCGTPTRIPSISPSHVGL